MEEKINYFIERTDERLSEMERKLDLLISFRIILITGAAVVSAIISSVVTLVFN